ncbi:MAG: ATP-binding protein [Bacteriovoracia bacterium]
MTVVLLTVPVLAGWNSVDAGYPFALWSRMQFNTALGLLFSAGFVGWTGRFRHRVVASFSIVVGALGGLTLIEYVFGVNFGIDELFRRAISSTVDGHPGRMAPNSAGAFCLLGLAGYFVSREIRATNRPVSWRSVLAALAASAVAAIGLVTLLAFGFRFADGADIASYARMSAPTALGFALLGVWLALDIFTRLRRSVSSTEHFLPAVVASSMLFLSVLVWQHLLAQEARMIRTAVENANNKHKEEILEYLKQITYAMQRYADRVEFLGTKNQRYLELDSKNYLAGLPVLKRIGITDSHFKVIWSYPPELRHQVSGFDQSGEDVRRDAFMAARENRIPTLSRTVELRSGGFGHLLPVALFPGGEFAGAAYATLQTDNIFAQRPISQDFHLQVQEGGRRVFSEDGRTPAVVGFADRLEIAWGLARWEVVAIPTTAFVDSRSSAAPHTIFALSLFFSALCGFLLRSAARLQVDRLKSMDQLERALYDAKAATRAKSDFLATMSHEIRTPLNGVIGMSSLLMETKLSQEQQELVHTVSNSGKTLLSLINDILDFSKIESGRMQLEEVEFDVAETLREILKPFELAAKGKNIYFRFDADTYGHRVIGDSGRLGQVVSNLVSNALKFTPQGSVLIRLNLRALGDRTIMRLEVTDTGIGIPDQAKSRMFEAFSQAEQSTSRKFGGTGLGLSISKRIVQLMGGTIGFQSMLGVGTTFRVEFAFRTGQAIAHSPSGEPSTVASSTKPLEGRVLVAEDNPTNQLVIARMLEKLGCKYHLVANGNEVLDALREAPFDLILMDCQMPDMDGYEATRLIRQSSTLNRAIPIVALTANAGVEDREKCNTVGMNDFLTKPVDRKALEAALRRYLAASDPKAA